MKKSLKPYAAAAALALSLTVPASADIFLQFETSNGTHIIKGESTSKDYEDHINVLSWSWGLSNSGTTHSGTGGGAGKASFQDISLTKFIDIASPTLYTRVADGVYIAKGTLTVTATGATGQIKSTTLELNDILATSASLGSTDGEDRPTENMTLNFSKFTLTNYVVDPATGTSTAQTPFCWDIAKNTGC